MMLTDATLADSNLFRFNIYLLLATCRISLFLPNGLVCFVAGGFVLHLRRKARNISFRNVLLLRSILFRFLLSGITDCGRLFYRFAPSEVGVF